MDLNKKKLWLAMATSLVALSSLTAADASGGSMKSSNKQTSNNNTSGGVQGGYDLSIDAAALVWKAMQGGTEFAAGAASRHVEDLESDWDWGFRVGLAYTMPHDKWNIRAGWDHLHVGAAESTSGSSTAPWWPFGQLAGAGDATINNNTQDPTTFNVSSHWHLDYDTVDLALRRDFQFSKWVCLAPHVGLRSAWIYQDQHFTFGKGTPSETEGKQKNNFWGLGIRAGFDTQWGLGRGWSIFGNVAAALLYGNYDVDSDIVEGTYTDGTDGAWDGNNSFHASRACADYTLGLRWNHMFSDNRYGLTFQVGYEQHIYWNMFESTIPGANAHNGDLTFTGWTFAGKFDF